MAAKTHREIEDESMKLVGDGSNLSNGGEDYDKKYEKLLAKYGLERKKTDYEKDMDEYGPRIKAAMEKTKEANKTAKIKDTSRPARDAESMKGVETKVKTSSGGYAEAETKEAPKKARTAVDQKKQATTKKNSPLRTPVKAPNLKKPGSSTSEKDKGKGNSKEAAATPKKPAETPKGGYKPENQDVKLAKEPRGIFKKGPLTLAVEEEHKRKQKALRAKWKKTLGFETLKINKKATDEEGRNILG